VKGGVGLAAFELPHVERPAETWQPVRQVSFERGDVEPMALPDGSRFSR
jgi:hypothetical protein